MEKNVIVVASVLGIQSPSGLQLIHGNRTVTDLKTRSQNQRGYEERRDCSANHN